MTRAHLRILDASSGSVAASAATGLLAGMGFTVWKLETANDGDPLRAHGPVACTAGSPHLPFAWTSRGKHWIGLKDDGTDRFRAARQRLAEAADVVIVSDLTTARALEVRARVVAVTPFGLTGPRSGWRASSIGIYHASGAGYVTPRAPAAGIETTPVPQAPWGELAAYFGGLYAAIAALACALGPAPGRAVDLSLQECLLPLLRRETGAWLYDQYLASRSERLWRVAPSAFYATSDSYVYVNVVEDKQWIRLCDLMDRPDLASDERFETAESRFVHLDVLDANLGPWFAAHPATEIFERCGSAGIPVGHAMAPEELLRCPQLIERGAVAAVEGVGSMPGLPIRRTGEPPMPWPEWDDPTPGRDSEAVMSAAGWSAAELADEIRGGLVFGGNDEAPAVAGGSRA